MGDLVFFGLWYAFGFVVLINEMRYGGNVTVGWILCIMCFAPLGPIWLIATAARLGWFSWFKKTCLDKIVIKRANNQGD